MRGETSDFVGDGVVEVMVKLVKRPDEGWFPFEEVSREFYKIREKAKKPTNPWPDTERLAVLKEKIDDGD